MHHLSSRPPPYSFPYHFTISKTHTPPFLPGARSSYVWAVDMDGIRAALQRMDCAAGCRSVLHRHLRANPLRRHRDDRLVPGLLQCPDGTQSRTVAGEYIV